MTTTNTCLLLDISPYTNLAKAIAHYYWYHHGQQEELCEIEQVAFHGLLTARESYNPEKAAFSTHVSHRCRGYLRHYYRKLRSIKNHEEPLD